VAIVDNLSSHKVAGIRDAIEAVGATIRYLPPYSPDLNPIENLFARLETLLRPATLRKVDALWDYIGELLDAFPPLECSNYIKSCGYVSSQNENALAAYGLSAAARLSQAAPPAGS